MVTTQQANAFVSGADLKGLPDYHSALAVLGPAGFEADTGKTQSVLVGSTINSFVKGVSAERRDAINDSSLFAQLVANKQVPNQSDLAAWYSAYFDALTNVGWTLQSRSFSTFEAGSEDADVHEAILTIASGLLGGTASAGYALIKLTLDSLKKLSDNSPWITVFKRESQHEKAARFQISLVNQDAGKDFVVSLMTFTLEASQTMEQLLFFKYKSMQATLRQFSGDITINDRVLSHVAPLIAKKVDAFSDGYVLGVDLR